MFIIEFYDEHFNDSSRILEQKIKKVYFFSKCFHQGGVRWLPKRHNGATEEWANNTLVDVLKDLFSVPQTTIGHGLITINVIICTIEEEQLNLFAGIVLDFVHFFNILLSIPKTGQLFTEQLVKVSSVPIDFAGHSIVVEQSCLASFGMRTAIKLLKTTLTTEIKFTKS